MNERQTIPGEKSMKVPPFAKGDSLAYAGGFLMHRDEKPIIYDGVGEV